jgi:hypothetical protein
MCVRRDRFTQVEGLAKRGLLTPKEADHHYETINHLMVAMNKSRKQSAAKLAQKRTSFKRDGTAVESPLQPTESLL